MNISSSISQIIYQTQLPGKILLKKAYLWPEYNAGSVERIKPVSEKAESLNYIKRSSYDPAQDISKFNGSNNVEYTFEGQIKSSVDSITPGLYFEALA